MQPYQQRVVDEKHDLDVLLERLTTFMDDPKVWSIPIRERTLLNSQRAAMMEYSRVLGERVAMWAKELA